MKCLKAEGLEFDQTSSNRELGDLYDSIKGRVTEVCVCDLVDLCSALSVLGSAVHEGRVTA